MKKRIFKRDQKGFTFAEMLIAILILLMVTAIVAAGIPVAANAYFKAVDGANAQLLLSTTMTALREELTTASFIDASAGTEIVFQSSRTRAGTRIWQQDGLVMITDYYPNSVSGATRELVTRSAATKNLSVQLTGISYAEGTVTIQKVAVFREGNELVTKENYQIRVIGQ